MVHTLRLDNYSTTPRKLVLGTNSSYGTESIKIERGAGWDGLNLTATWHIPGREEPLRVALLDGDAMDVPPEVTKEAKDGVLVLAGLASGVQRASCNVEYLILEQAGIYGGTDAEPTPELAAQVLEATMKAKANAEAAAQDASEAKANANKAQQAAENAAADAAKAGPYTEAALNAQKAAEAARDTAIAAGSCAENAANTAAGSMTAAAEIASKAAASEKAAAASAIAAAGSAANAEAQKTATAKFASDAQGYMQTASSAATAANASAENAAGSKAAAASSATASANSATAAAASASTASAKATEAADSASTAAASEQAAAQAAEIAQSAAGSLQLDVSQIKDDLTRLNNTVEVPVAAGKVWTATDDGAGWANPQGGGKTWIRLADFYLEQETNYVEIPAVLAGTTEFLVYLRNDSSPFTSPNQIQFAFGDKPYPPSRAVGVLIGGISNSKVYCGLFELIANADDGTMQVFNVQAYSGPSSLGGHPNVFRQIIGKYDYDYSKTTKVLFCGNGRGIPMDKALPAGTRIALFAR